MNNAVLGETMENIRVYRDIKLVTTEARWNCLQSEPNYDITNFFSKSLLTKLKKTQIFINKPVYVGLSILEINKIAMYEFWYACLKSKFV